MDHVQTEHGLLEITENLYMKKKPSNEKSFAGKFNMFSGSKGNDLTANAEYLLT